MTTKEAAALLGISPRRVQALIKSGRLPAKRIGRDWHIKPKDVDALQHRPTGRPKKG